MRNLVILLAVVIIGMFASVGPPVRAQVIYQPPTPILVPITGPNCPQVAGLQTAPWGHVYGVCTYYGGLANLTVPAGLVLRVRSFARTSWWPFSQEVTQWAYPGQTVQADWFEPHHLYPPYGYAPGPIYVPPPIYAPPLPGLPVIGTPAPPRTETGVGNFTLAFAQGWPVAGWRLQYSSGRIVWNCHTLSAPEFGWVTDGVLSPNAWDIARAPNPCP